MPLPISTVFADLPDPRSEVNRRHLLTDILTIALCGVIGGADGWEAAALVAILAAAVHAAHAGGIVHRDGSINYLGLTADHIFV